MNTSSADLRSLPQHDPSGDAGRRILDTKSAPDTRGAGASEATDHHADQADQAAFGEFLRQARERRQLTVEQIASQTKIAPRHLNALEQGNVTSLPTGMYRRAMLRAYAESVGLDKETALEHFERTFDPHAGAAEPRAADWRAVEPRSAPAPLVPSTRRRPARQRDLRVLLAVVVLAATGVVALITGDGEAPSPSSPAAAAGPQAPAVAADASGVDARPVRAVAPPAEAPAALAAERASGGLDRANSTPATDAARSDGPLSPVAPATTDAVTATGGRESATEARTVPARASDGQLTIVTEPAGARVTIDGTGWGVTPLTVRHLPFGSKRVRITRDGYVSQERIVSVSADRPVATMRVTLGARP